MSDSPIKSEEHHSVHIGEPDSKGRRVSPWSWVPSVYFAQGLQYAIVVQLFAIIFFTMGIPQGDTLFWVGLLSFPWTIKPLWGPLVDKYGAKRAWTYLMQGLVGISFLAIAFSLIIPGSQTISLGSFSMPLWFLLSVVFLAVLAFAGATHDIACDGYYMLGLNEKQQAFYVGVRSTLFRAALIFANGILIWIAGLVQSATGLDEVTSNLLVKEKAAEVAQAPDDNNLFTLDPWPTADGQGILMMPDQLGIEQDGSSFVSIRLNEPVEEGDERVVVLSLDKADQGIGLSKANSRLIFNAGNWSQAVDVPITAADNAKIEAEDSIKAQSGNIPFSWLVVCVICGGMFFIIAGWHKFILPYPSGDIVDTTNRPNFLVPLSALLVTVGIPFGLIWLYMYATNLPEIKETIQEKTIGIVEDPSLQVLREKIEGNGDDKTLDQQALMGLITTLREEKLARSAANLQSLLEIREILSHNGVLDSGETAAQLSEAATLLKEDVSLYGNPELRRLLLLFEGINQPDIEADTDTAGTGEEGTEQVAEGTSAEEDADTETKPLTVEEFDRLLAKARNPLLSNLGEDAEFLVDALTAVESSVKAEVLGEDLSKADLALPENSDQLDELLAVARETPTSLQVKGFNFYYTATKLIILILIGLLIIKIPFIWQPVRGAIFAMSDVSQIGFAEVFETFFVKSGMAITLGFLLTFRLGEAQLAQVKNLFLLDAREANGLAMSLGEVAFTNSVVYLGALTIGGLLGGFLIARFGLKAVIWLMVAAMHLPNLLYIMLSTTQPDGVLLVNFVVGLESFGYGFGFTAYLMVMILAAQGPYKTAHYALCTGAMALGYMIPGMWAGYLQELVGYTTFFWLVMVFTLPGTILIPFLKIDPDFGKKV